jgi:hypothetical protein
MAIPYHALFNLLLYSPVFAQAPESNEARLMQRLLDALAGYDYRTDVVPTLAGAKVAAESDMAIGCFLLAIDGPNEAEVQALVHTIRHERGLDTPIYLVSELKGIETLSLEPLGDVTGYIYLDHETPAFSAKETIFALESYAASLKPPFFGALMDYDYEGRWVAMPSSERPPDSSVACIASRSVHEVTAAGSSTGGHAFDAAPSAVGVLQFLSNHHEESHQ